MDPLSNSVVVGCLVSVPGCLCIAPSAKRATSVHSPESKHVFLCNYALQLFRVGCTLLPSSHPLGKSLRIKNLSMVMRMVAIVFRVLCCIWSGSLVLKPQSGSGAGTHVLWRPLAICTLSDFSAWATDLQGKLDSLMLISLFPFSCSFFHEFLLCFVKKRQSALLILRLAEK